ASLRNRQRRALTRNLPRFIHGQLAVRARRLILGKLRLCAPLSENQRLELRGGQGGTEVITLILITAERPQERELFFRFHALRHYFQSQAMGKRDNGPHDGGIVGPRCDLTDE